MESSSITSLPGGACLNQRRATHAGQHYAELLPRTTQLREAHGGCPAQSSLAEQACRFFHQIIAGLEKAVWEHTGPVRMVQRCSSF